ncbi:hypothetical protein [Microbispora sp. ATCC PTA-5024]|uniref:hypothetical protein n=1 Tax=Microbispora sp. ATCC PTA-5024 TaxID=316330 RepID=UPI0003DD1883|nr:hypothetical protein [Microbispora sp. ATCC PTA-5024]ETK33360.1 hypothetical protein MPTA5024_24680 [Microbispora sp. ATCC PTA-5024]
MLRRLLLACALIATSLIIPTAVQALPAGAAVHSSAASCYEQVGNHWECITPGVFCPATAHGKYGYAKVTHKKYRCIKASGDTHWRWKPVIGSAGTPTRKCSRAFLPLPDPKCQPGALNPAVTQSTIDTTICVAGYSKTVRPSVSYTNSLKTKQIAEYGYKDANPAHYEEDHLIPLSLAGSPKSAKNLWPEPRDKAGGSTALDKDDVEFKLYKAVCAGTVQLAPAQKAIAKDWRTALDKVGL